MLTIQEAGIEILGNNPKSLYFFCGAEYGIKVKYLEHLKEYYGSKVEAESVEAVLTRFKKKRLISGSKSLYVARYDGEFISNLSDQFVKDVKSVEIDGTLVCLYEDESSYKKLDKYFPDSVVRFDPIGKDMIQKYLTKDFPDIDKIHIQYVSQYCNSYSQANEICNQISNTSNKMEGIRKGEFLYSFGLSNSSSEEEFKVAIASRNYSAIVTILDNFDGDLNYLLNCICNTMVELDKILSNKTSDSLLRQYIKLWTVQDIYYMFNHTYNEIFRIRTNGISNIYDSILYLAALLRYKNIPSITDVI